MPVVKFEIITAFDITTETPRKGAKLEKGCNEWLKRKRKHSGTENKVLW